MVVAALILVVLAALAALVVVRPRLLRGGLSALREQASTELTARNADVDRRLEAVVETMDRRLAELDTKVDRRLATAGQTTTQIHERLGEMTKATAELNERAKELGRIEQALRPPKARGGFGELLLENVLRDRLPSGAYDLQYTFSTGERVDAVIRTEQLVPVDAKFPLGNFERMTAAADLAVPVLQPTAALQTDLIGFRDGFELVGKHLANAPGKSAQAEKRLGRFATKLDRAGEQQIELAPAEPPPALPRALDAA